MTEYVNQSAGLLTPGDVKDNDKILILAPAYKTVKGEREFWNVKIKLPNGQKKLATIFDVSGDRFVSAWGKTTEAWVGHTALVSLKESKAGKMYVLFLPADDAIVDVAADQAKGAEYPTPEANDVSVDDIGF